MCDNRLEVFILLIHHAEKRVYDCVRLVQLASYLPRDTVADIFVTIFDIRSYLRARMQHSLSQRLPVRKRILLRFHDLWILCDGLAAALRPLRE